MKKNHKINKKREKRRKKREQERKAEASKKRLITALSLLTVAVLLLPVSFYFLSYPKKPVLKPKKELSSFCVAKIAAIEKEMRNVPLLEAGQSVVVDLKKATEKNKKRSGMARVVSEKCFDALPATKQKDLTEMMAVLMANEIYLKNYTPPKPQKPDKEQKEVQQQSYSPLLETAPVSAFKRKIFN